MQFNSDNTKPVYTPRSCGLYDIQVAVKPELRATDNATRVIRFKFDIGDGKFASDDIYVTEKAGWRVERLLRCLKGSTSVTDEELCSDAYLQSLVGCRGKADVGIQLYDKNGQTRKVNEIVNYVSDKNPSLNLSPDLAYTTDKRATNKAGTGQTTSNGAGMAASGEDLPAHSDTDPEDVINEAEVPF